MIRDGDDSIKGAACQETAGQYLRRGTVLLSALGLAGPAAGLAVEVAMSWRFGVSQTVDAFRAASLILVFAAQLCFSHLLPNVLAPLFLQYEGQGRKREAWSLAVWVGISLGCASTCLVGVAWLRARDVVGLLAPGLQDAGVRSAVVLTRYFALALLLMSFSGVMNAILAARRIVWLPGLSQLVANVVLVSFILARGEWPGATSLAYGVLAGAAATFCLYVAAMLCWAGAPLGCLGQLVWPCPRDGLKRAASLSGPLLLMLLVMQWGAVVINRALSCLPEGALAQFGYAWKLLVLAGLAATSFATAIFPLLAEAHGEGDRARVARLVTTGVRGAVLLSLPSAALLFAARLPVAQVFFGRGAMDSAAVAGTAQVFGALVIGSPAAALALVLFKALYSEGRNYVALGATVMSAAVLTCVVPPAARHWGVLGVAWACTGSNWLVAAVLVVCEAHYLQTADFGALVSYSVRLAVVAAGIFACGTGALALVDHYLAAGWWGSVGKLAVAGFSCATSGWALARALGVGEGDRVVEYFWVSFKRVVGVRVT